MTTKGRWSATRTSAWTGAGARSRRWPRLAEQERAALGGDLRVPIVALVDGPLLPWLRPDPQRIRPDQ